MKRQWHAIAARGRAWAAALTPRERAAIALMAAVGVVALAFRAEDDMTAARHAADEAILAKAAVSGLAREERIALSTVVDAAAREARRASIGGETIHIARARAQSVVASLAQQAGLEGVTASLKSRETRKAKGALIEPIEVNVTSSYDKAALARFLQLLSVSDHSLSPVSINVRAADASRLEMRIVAYALVVGDET